MHTGPESAVLATHPTLIQAASGLLRRIPFPTTPRHLLAFLLLLAVGLVASKLPHLHHGAPAGLHDFPELLIAGLTGPGIWQRYELALHVGGHHSERTIKQYGEQWHDWLAFLHSQRCRRKRCDQGFACPTIRWERVGEQHLRAYLKRPVRKGPRKGDALSLSSRSAYIVAITGVYRYAVRKRILTRDPLADVRPPRVGESLARAYSRAELQRIFVAAATHHDRRVYILCWLGYHGLRCEEMARLGREHVLLDDEPWLLVSGKGNKQRMVPVHQLFVPVLRQWAGPLANGPLVVQHDRHGQPTMEPLKASTVSNLLGRFIKDDAGIYGGAHRLRHTAGTILLDVGENIDHVREFLGHATLTMALRYAKAHVRNVRRDVARMPDPLNPFAQPAGEPEPVAEVLRRVLTPDLSRRLLADPDLAGLRPLLELAGRLDLRPSMEEA